MSEHRLDVVVDGLFQYGPWWVERVLKPIKDHPAGSVSEVKWVARLHLEGPYMAEFGHLYEAKAWVSESFKTPEGRDLRNG